MTVRELERVSSVELHFDDLCRQEEAVVAVVAYVYPEARVCEFGSKARRQLGIVSDGHVFDVASDADLMIFLPEGVMINFARKRLDQELDKRRVGPNVEEMIHNPKLIGNQIFWLKIQYRMEDVELYDRGCFSFPWREGEFRPALPLVVAEDGRW